MGVCEKYIRFKESFFIENSEDTTIDPNSIDYNRIREAELRIKKNRIKKRFVCDVCGRKLVTKQALQNHKLKVGACEKFLILSEKKKAMIEQVCVLDSSIGKYHDAPLFIFESCLTKKLQNEKIK